MDSVIWNYFFLKPTRIARSFRFTWAQISVEMNWNHVSQSWKSVSWTWFLCEKRSLHGLCIHWQHVKIFYGIVHGYKKISLFPSCSPCVIYDRALPWSLPYVSSYNPSIVIAENLMDSRNGSIWNHDIIDNSIISLLVHHAVTSLLACTRIVFVYHAEWVQGCLSL